MMECAYKSAAAFSKIGSTVRGWSDDMVKDFKEMCESKRLAEVSELQTFILKVEGHVLTKVGMPPRRPTRSFFWCVSTVRCMLLFLGRDRQYHPPYYTSPQPPHSLYSLHSQ